MDATPRGGAFTTKSLTFKGSRLVLNARAMEDVTGKMLDTEGEEGLYSVRHELTWDGFTKLAGKPVCLRFRMWNAQLYTFQFQD